MQIYNGNLQIFLLHYHFVEYHMLDIEVSRWIGYICSVFTKNRSGFYYWTRRLKIFLLQCISS